MKMKKMLAILAALSVLGTTGLTVGAEDTATTTEPATEAITTTETEAETTAAETTAETETTVETDVTEETAATEENQVVGKQIINKGDVLTFNGTLSYANGKNRPILNLDTPIEATVGGVDETVTYVRLNEESLTYADGTKLTVTGTVDLTAFAGTGQNVVFLSNNTITENNATTTTTAAETTPTMTTTTTEATDAIIDQKTETIIAQGRPYTLRFVLFEEANTHNYYIAVYVNGKLSNISHQPVDSNIDNPKSVSSYAGICKGTVSQITITDWGTTTTTSFHYQYDPVQGAFIDSSGHEDEDSETTAAIKALYDKFVAAYGKPITANYGDFNNDGKLDAYYTYYLEGVGYTTYLVTDDAIVNAGGVPGDYAGITDYAFFECNGYRFRMNFRNRIVATYATGNVTIDRIESDGTLKQVNFGENVLSDSYEVSGTPNYTADLSNDQVGKASTYFSCDGNVLTITHYFYDNGRDVGSNSYVYDAATNTFVAGSTTDDNQEKTFTVEIPYAYFTVIDSVTGEVVTRPGANKSMVNAVVTSCTNGNVASLNYGNEANNSSLDAFLQSITVSDVKPGTLTIKGTCQSYSSLTPEEKAAGYTTLPHCGDAIENYFTLTVTIDENGNIVTGDSGKTDNGSASNAPASTATKNTSGTPKTGDTTTVPAVAVGLTLTTAGVVAFISKRKK